MESIPARLLQMGSLACVVSVAVALPMFGGTAAGAATAPTTTALNGSAMTPASATKVGPTTFKTRSFPEIAAWTLKWTYGCSELGSSYTGNFAATVTPTAGGPAVGLVPSQAGTTGKGVVRVTATGIFTVAVTTNCSWNITVTGPAAVGIAGSSDGGGYWIALANGGVETAGDVGFFGSMGGQPLNSPIVHIVPTPDGQGYWFVAADGGLFSYGDATFHGSAVGMTAAPIVGMATDLATGGYWEVNSDGTVFNFNAPAF